MLRIYFTGDDLRRIRIAPGPDAMWEVLFSLHRLRRPEASAVFGYWKRQAWSQVPASTRLVADLAPATGYTVDFLTPATDTGTLDAGMEVLRGTSRTRLHTDMTELAVRHPGRPVPAEARPLADGAPEALDQLTDAVRGYFDACLAPYWSRIKTQIDRDRARRRKHLAEGGWPEVLANLHPSARWSFPVLELEYPADHDIAIDGRALVLQPSFFCWGTPTTLLDASLPPVLAYPIRPDLDWAVTRAPLRGQAVAALLGRTRAQVLETIAAGGCNTTELACRVPVPLPTASRQTAVLREAGLITSLRRGNHVRHTVTPLGIAVLEGDIHDSPVSQHDPGSQDGQDE